VLKFDANKQAVGLSVLCWTWQEHAFSRREDVLTFNLLFNKSFNFLYFQCDLQKGKAGINYLTVNTKMVYFRQLRRVKIYLYKVTEKFLLSRTRRRIT
jgi:hypothetical protein